MESHYVKTVNLKEWWLTKADNSSSGNRVAVAGIESAGRLALRVFLSAPIVERLDIFTLKTEDGVFVSLKGLINKQQTCANGFSEEVFKYFLIGFPPDWEECAEKCLQQGIGSEATADADLNPEQSTVTKMGNTTVRLKQLLWKGSDSNKRPEHTGERQEAVTELDYRDRDSCMNTGSYDSNIGLMEEGVRYHLRNREVQYSEAEGVYRGKHANNVNGKPSSMKSVICDAASTILSVASLENSQNPDMTPHVEKSPKEQAEHQFRANHAKYVATISSMTISGEASVICMHKINEAQKSQRHDVTEPITKNAGEDKNLISDRSLGGKSRQSKKRKRNGGTAQTSIIMTKSLLQKTLENTDAFTTPQVVVGSENSVKSGGVAVGGNNIENPNGEGEGENKRPPVFLRSKNVKIKKRSTCEDSAAVETNVHFSPQDADNLENSTSDNIFGGKSHLSKNGQRSCLIRTTLNHKNSHDSARPTMKTCTSKGESHSKAAGGVAVSGNNIENPTGRDEGENRRTSGRLRSENVQGTPAGRGEGENRRTSSRLKSENVKSKKQSTREASVAVETNVCFSPQAVDKLEKSHLSKRKKQSSEARTTLNNKSIHHSARPTLKTRTSKVEGKAAVTDRERKTSVGSMRKLQSRRKLDYDQETPCTPVRENKTPTSQTVVLRTSRSGRVLLPTLEFWRSQSPLYDADHGLSAIRERSSVLKVSNRASRRANRL